MERQIEVDVKLSWREVRNFAFYSFYFRTPWVFYLTAIAALCFIYQMLYVFNYIPIIGEASPLVIYFWSFILFGGPIIVYLRAKNAYENEVSLNSKNCYRIDSDSIQVYTKNDFDRLKWDKLFEIKETKNAILFFRNQFEANILPKRFLNENDLKDIKELIRSKKNLNFKLLKNKGS